MQITEPERCWRIAGSWEPDKVTPESRAAGRNASFVEFYSLVQNFDAEPPVAGAVFDRARTDFASHLA